MGIKENFTQALRELSGGGKEAQQDKTKAAQVEDLRRAVESDITEMVEEPSEETTYEPVSAQTIQDSIASFPQNLSMQSNAPFAAPKSSHAGLDVNIQDLRDMEEVEMTTGPLYNGNQSSSSGNSYADTQQSLGIPQTGSMPLAPFGDSNDGMGDELTVISKNTVVEGNIRSFANMNIEGNIRGDIETTKNVDLNGKVIGNLTCNNAQMLTSQIQGNVRMKGNIVMGRDTLLIGDLISTYAKVNGKIKGNIEIGGKAELKGDAVIFGDISASTITVDDGAIIQGYVSTTFLNKEESRNIFPETISIAE